MNQRWSRRMGLPLSVMLGLMVALGGLPPATHGGTAAPLTRPLVQGQKHLAPPVALTHLAHAALSGRLHHFRTNDPAYTCLNGQALDVVRAPQEFPDDYVVYRRGQGARCPTGTWLYPQEPRMPALRLAITAL